MEVQLKASPSKSLNILQTVNYNLIAAVEPQPRRWSATDHTHAPVVIICIFFHCHVLYYIALSSSSYTVAQKYISTMFLGLRTVHEVCTLYTVHIMSNTSLQVSGK